MTFSEKRHSRDDLMLSCFDSNLLLSWLQSILGIVKLHAAHTWQVDEGDTTLPIIDIFTLSIIKDIPFPEFVHHYYIPHVYHASKRKQSQKIYADTIAVGRNALFAAMGLGSHNVPVTPKVLGKLYWSVSIPRMTCGLEATPISARELDELEQAHRQHAKIVQGLSRSSPNPAVLATLGWLSLSAHISKIKLVFLWRMLCLPGNVYKDVVLTILNKCFQCKNDVDIGTGPIHDMYKAVCKYNMKDELMRCIQMGEYEKCSEREIN